MVEVDLVEGMLLGVEEEEDMMLGVEVVEDEFDVGIGGGGFELDDRGGVGGWFEFDVTSGGGGHIVGHVAHSLMQYKSLEGASTLSSDVNLANKASTMNPAFKIQGNQLFLMNPRLLLWPIWTKVGWDWRNKEGMFMA